MSIRNEVTPLPAADLGIVRDTENEYVQINAEEREREEPLGQIISYKALATCLLNDLQTGQTKSNKRKLPKTQSPLAQSLARNLLVTLHLDTAVNVQLEDEGKLEIAPSLSLTREEYDARRGVVGYNWKSIANLEEQDKNEIIEGLEDYIRKANKAVEELINPHLNLIDFLAMTVASENFPLEEAKQEAALSLVAAANRFDWRTGYPFRPYAKRTIKGDLSHYIRDKARIVRPERPIHEALPRVLQARDELLREGEPTSYDTVVEKTGLSAEVVREALIFAARGKGEAQSFGQSIETHDGKEVTLGDIIQDAGRGVEDVAIEATFINQVLASFPPQIREIIIACFIEDETQVSIGKRLGLTTRQVAERVANARRILKAVYFSRVK